MISFLKCFYVTIKLQSNNIFKCKRMSCSGLVLINHSQE
ncbi:MAG TPA: hypothetical protein DIW15_00845 [Bavariicoccus seileri]|uniref:Uncharacterized protein n=1 Tax=Bavariicoccus seileri TaxID=549685 RepID=A0A3D4S5L6_9ENTE|nr:hypothetical protein [Bavariicoccus seileri]